MTRLERLNTDTDLDIEANTEHNSPVCGSLLSRRSRPLQSSVAPGTSGSVLRHSPALSLANLARLSQRKDHDVCSVPKPGAITPHTPHVDPRYSCDDSPVRGEPRMTSLQC